MKYREGYYYDADCPRHGRVKAAYAKNRGGVFICPSCNNHEGVKPAGEGR